MSGKNILLVFALAACLQQSLFGQCPDRPWTAKRITALKNSRVRPADQLKELNGYFSSFQKCPVAHDTVLAYLMQRIGALYSFQGDFENAVRWSLRSIEQEASQPDAVSRCDFFIRVYNNLQMFYDSLHLFRQKMAAVDSCIQIAMRNDRITDNVIFNVWQRVDYSFDVGDYQRCADYSAIGENIARYSRIKEDSVAYVLGFFNMHVNALTLMKNFDEAENILQHKIEEYKKNKNEKNCGVFYNQLAEISTQRQEYGRSLSLLEKSLKCNRAIGGRLYCKQSLNNIGFLYQSRLNKPDSALQYYRRALNCLNNVSSDQVMDVIETLNVYDNIANVFAGKNEFDSAFFYYHKAFGQVRPDINEEGILNFSADEFIANKKMQYLTGLIKDKADAYLLQYRFANDTRYLKKAIATYKIADRVLSRVRSEQAESLSGIAWRANARNLYENAAEACYLYQDEESAFYFFEKSRAALLNDQIAQQRHASEEDIRHQVGLKRKLNELKATLSNTDPSSQAYVVLQKNMYAFTQENDRISMTIKQRDPLYYRNYIDTAFISLEELRKNILLDEKALMEIFYGDSSVYVLFISGAEKRIDRIDKKKYDSLTSSFIRYVSDPALLNRYYDKFIKNAHELYALLFDVSTGRDSGKASKQVACSHCRLIISPDGQYFPFEALAEDSNPVHPRFLLYEQPVSYTYSASYLMYGIPDNTSSELFLGIAPVKFAAALHLPELPASDHSLNRISSLFSRSDQFVHAAATKNNFLDHFFRYRIIQLYTHASGGGPDEEPEIYLADSSLKLSDINPVFGAGTRLIVLSACETGRGTFYKGEGVFSFNRTFASIGIPASMVNLWSVENQAVYRLTELFYANLAKGFPLDVSLQKAKIEFIETASKDRSMPYYWASAVIVGRTEALIPKPVSFFWRWSLLAIPAVVFFIVYKMRAKQPR